MYIRRDLEIKVSKYLKRKEIIAIVGTRQCGKTTLMKHLFDSLKNAKFINFENRKILGLFNNDIGLFVKKYIKNVDYLLIDEFQYARKGGKTLKFLYDTYDTKIIISGSSAAELSIQSIKFLVGRIFVFILAPLSFSEFLRYKDKDLHDIFFRRKLSEISIKMINNLYSEYIIYGGYPEVILAKSEETKKDILNNIFSTYLLREIKEILQISDDYKISNLIKALSLQVGNLVNYNELSSLTGFKYYDLVNYINILKKTFILLESRPFFTNKRKEIVKSPRLYFLDNGFRNISIDNFAPIEMRVDKGILNENFVASELFKKNYNIQYWRTKSKAEVDFVIEKEGNIIPIEVKSGLKKTKVMRSFLSFLANYKPKKAIILSENLIAEKNNIIFRPIFLVSREI